MYQSCGWENSTENIKTISISIMSYFSGWKTKIMIDTMVNDVSNYLVSISMD